MALPYRLTPVGFEIGSDRRGCYLKLRLENTQPHTYSITRIRFETEGSYSDRPHIRNLQIGPDCRKLIRFDVHRFWDLAFWVSGTRDSTQRPLQRGLAMFVADWLPPFPWQAENNKMAARRPSSSNSQCGTLVERLYTSPTAVWRTQEPREIWPVRTNSKDDWSYYVAVRRRNSTLKAGPFLRCRGDSIERFYTGNRGSDWYDVVAPTKNRKQSKGRSSTKR